jgi:DNA polymerase-4
MDEGRVRKIIHIDVDVFYPSFEPLNNPVLKSRPMTFGCPASFGDKSAAAVAACEGGRPTQTNCWVQ